jgi:hypothetical protein
LIISMLLMLHGAVPVDDLAEMSVAGGDVMTEELSRGRVRGRCR